MNAETVFRASARQLAEEYDLVPRLLDRHMEILYPLEAGRHLVQFMVMGGKQHLRPASGMFVQVFGDGPCDGYAVKRARPPADFIHQHQAAVGNIVQYTRSFVHFHHKRRLSGGKVVRGAHPGENLINQSDGSRIRRDERSRLRHKDNQGHLAEQRRFAGHVGACNHQYLLRLVVHIHVIGNVLLSRRQAGLYNRMPAVFDGYRIRGVDFRTDILPAHRQGGETIEHVQSSHATGARLHPLHIGKGLLQQSSIQALLYLQDFLFRTQDFRLVFLQLFGNIAFRVGQGLLAYPFLRHLVLVRIGHLQIIAEHVVVPDFQRGNARPLRFRLLQTHEVILAGIGDGAQIIQLLVHTFPDKAAFGQQHGRIRAQHLTNAFAQFGTIVQTFRFLDNGRTVRCRAQGTDIAYRFQGAQHLKHLSRIGFSYSHFGNQTLQIPHGTQRGFRSLPPVFPLHHGLHRIQTLVYFRLVFQRQQQPAAKQARTHG